MYDDPIVNEVRKTRERLAEELQFDVSAIFEDLRKREARLGTRLVSRQGRGKTEEAAIRDQDSAALQPDK